MPMQATFIPRTRPFGAAFSLFEPQAAFGPPAPHTAIATTPWRRPMNVSSSASYITRPPCPWGPPAANPECLRTLSSAREVNPQPAHQHWSLLLSNAATIIASSYVPVTLLQVRFSYCSCQHHTCAYENNLDLPCISVNHTEQWLLVCVSICFLRCASQHHLGASPAFHQWETDRRFGEMLHRILSTNTYLLLRTILMGEGEWERENENKQGQEQSGNDYQILGN